MRIWSVHPKYLDPAGMVALWRETLLAQKVLAGKTKGYKNHPQLDRFKKTPNPLRSIGIYLSVIADEAERRGYKFDRSKILMKPRKVNKISVTDKQLEFEREHLLRKLKKRSPVLYRQFSKEELWDLHPTFSKIRGPIEDWERP